VLGAIAPHNLRALLARVDDERREAETGTPERTSRA
jgi:hypothetical protein